MADVITMLALSPTMDEGTLVEWLKSEGDSVEEGELIAEIETDKATMEMESFFEGTLLKLLAEKGQALAVGAPLAIVGEAGEDISSVLADLASNPPAAAPEAPAATPAPQALVVEEAPVVNTGRLIASPVARKMAAESNLDLARIAGSGPKGRIIKRDIEKALKGGVPAQSRPAAIQAPAPAETLQVPLSQMRRTIARRLVEVWQSTPVFYLTTSINMAPAMAFRKELNAQLAATEAGVKVSVNDMIVKASALALKSYPKMNVSFQGDHIAHYGDAHIGVAVAIEDGLITPVLQNADRMSLATISTTIRELAGRARDKRLQPHEYTGSTFTISNLGMFGIDHFSAIINPPEAGILACGAVKKEPVVQDGELAVGTTMKLTLTCDHRAVDGAVGSEFLLELQKLLENPFLLVI